MEGLLHASQLYSLFTSKISCHYHKCSTWGKQHSHFIEDSEESEKLAQNYTDHQWQCWDLIPELIGSRIHALDHIAAQIAEGWESRRVSLLFTPFQIWYHLNQHLDRSPALLSPLHCTEGRGCGHEFALLKSLNCISSIVEKAITELWPLSGDFDFTR